MEENKGRNIRIVLSYDGNGFCGWQIQQKERTVEGVLAEALYRIHGQNVRFTAAGRTDSGVHARGQVVNFISPLKTIPPDRYKMALNSLLPSDVRIVKSDEVPASFDARRSALGRLYRYNIFPGAAPSPSLKRYSWDCLRYLNIRDMNRIAAPLVGKHDFTTFAATGSAYEHNIRNVFSTSFFEAPPFIAFHIHGNAFLWRMVRSIVGTIIDIHMKGGGAAEMKRRLRKKDRSLAGATAPAKGLVLQDVFYGEDL